MYLQPDFIQRGEGALGSPLPPPPPQNASQSIYCSWGVGACSQTPLRTDVLRTPNTFTDPPTCSANVHMCRWYTCGTCAICTCAVYVLYIYAAHVQHANKWTPSLALILHACCSVCNEMQYTTDSTKMLTTEPYPYTE